ncbi:MAG TPA: hypothetical protein VMS22_06975 [Candidatus Eisenbacteria bacterium]|nr:hypothetical protein [Candidatus Eisenbacteria bacterium]
MTAGEGLSAQRLRVPVDGVVLEADLHLPEPPLAVVVVARCDAPHDAAMRSDAAIGVFAAHGLATVIVDLLVASEVAEARRKFDVFLLARRLEALTDTVAHLPAMAGLPVGYVAAGPGAAGALVAALGDPRIRAIVSVDGRPDLAEGVLGSVTVPVLLIARETERGMNAAAFERMRCSKELAALDDRTGDTPIDSMLAWLSRHLVAPAMARQAESAPAPKEVRAPRRRGVLARRRPSPPPAA